MINGFHIWNKKDYRSKWKLLLWSVLPILAVCYLLAFKKTFTVIKEYKANLALADKNELRKDSVMVYDVKMSVLDSWKKQYLLDSAVMDADIIASVNLSCNEIGIDFKEYKLLGLSSQGIWTRLITVGGDFRGILQLIYRLEQVNKICRIGSINFQKTKQGEEGEQLNCSLYVQNILKNN